MAMFQRIRGLTTEQARENLLKLGPNLIFEPARISFFRIARHEVTEPMILLLFVVGFFYSIWGELGDALTIFVVILLLVLAEVNNEFRAKRAISSLEKIAAPKTRVMRDGKVVEIDSAEVVPDDLLILVSGTKVAADALIMRSAGLQVDESALTGESFPVEKSDGDLVSAGTVIINGEGEARVTITGIGTRLGRISAAAKAVRPPRTALQVAMRDLSGRLVYVAVFFSVLIPLIGWFRGQEMKTMFLTGLSLAFATIPEELPIIITMVLGLGAYTLSKKNFLVKKIKAAETLGNATVIVTDKTGTITESRMKIVSVFPGDESAVLNNALLSLPEFSLSPLDREIKERAHTLNLNDAGAAVVSQRDLGGGRKTHAVVRIIDDKETLFLSGAPEEVFSACREVPAAAREDLLNQAGKGRRVIAVASGEGRNEKELEFGGLIAFEDPAREGVKETIYTAADAGIRTIMVTGDHPLTAGFIAREVGIKSGKILTGEELDRMDDARLQEEVRECSVFARTAPEHKYRIVQALQSNGEIVAVTGDGINDALALKAADIGIAMGIRGTDVAKEAAEVVLADDNFVTIGQGIFEGRKFFDNLLKGVKYYLSVKTALIMIFLVPVVIGIPMPFAPIQIILLELFMDLAASAGFVSEPKEKNIYTRLPRNPGEAIFNFKTIADIFVKGVVLFVAVMIVYFFAIHSGMGMRETQTLAFSAWIFAHIFLAYISRSDKEPVFSIGLFKNSVINLWMAAAVIFLLAGVYVPFIGDRLQLAVIPPVELLFIFLTTALVVGSLEVRKIIFSRG